MRTPCCNVKSTKGKGHLLRCPLCNGEFDPKEIASGRVEGGDYSDRDPAARLQAEEEGGPNGYAIKSNRKLKGGL